MQEVLARHGHHDEPVQAGVVGHARVPHLHRGPVGGLEGRRVGQGGGGRVGQAAYGRMGGRHQRVRALRRIEARGGAVRHRLHVGAARDADQVAVLLQHHRHAVAAEGQALEEGRHVLQRQVCRDHALERTAAIVDPARARGNQFVQLEVHVDRRPRLQGVRHAGLVPGPLARIEDARLHVRRSELARDAAVVIEAARPLALEAQAQFGVDLRGAPQADEAALPVAVVRIVVRVAVHSRGEPESRAQRRQFVGDRIGRGNALGERDLQHGLGAGDMALDGLLDAVHRLGEQLPRQVVDGVAPRGIRQDADDDRRSQDQCHVRQGEQCPQGQA